MLMPKKQKYRKTMKGRNKGEATRGNTVAFGRYGLQATTAERVTSRQIEAARRAMTRYVKRGGKIWIRIFPSISVSRKPHDVKMGSGKGNPEFFCARVKPGTVMFEMDGVTEEIAREAMRLAGHKLPVRTRFLIKHSIERSES
ncbi:50S ribosomal protein L16 [Candidatus Saccharibacteria bacterium]|jgi:large subunit ribosomal protein L16|nr:50S ribosomal protein L16 [Candidatus Saccharibacteria bacterium]